MAHKQCSKHAVVIGSGFGGLAAAVRLGARGYRVSVFEALDSPGGKATVETMDGHVFDMGPTIITAPFLFEELWSLAGRSFNEEIDLVSLDPFYRIQFHDGSVLDCSADAAFMRAQIQQLAPADVAGYDRFLEKSRAIFEIGFEELAHRSFDKFAHMVKVVPDLVRLRSEQSVYKMASRFFSDERLRIAFSFHPLLIGGNPLSTTSIYSLIAFLERQWGVHFVMGGTGRLVQGLVDLITSQGGAVHLNSPVASIDTVAGRASGVTLADGSRVQADVVVSNVDSIATYESLLGDLNKRRWHKRRVQRAQLSMSLFVWYFGTDRQYEDVPHHLMLMGPRYTGLLQDIFKHRQLASDFSLYLHRPTATDTSLAPPGRETFYVLSPVPNLLGNVDWMQQAERYRQAICTRLQEAVLPDLEAHLTASFVMTPQDFASRYGAPQGAAFGLAPEFWQSAWFRPHNRSEEIEGLYLVGAGTHPGAGVPGVLSSARVLDEVVDNV